MTQLAINTTQNVPITFTAASVADRLLGSLTDYLVKIAYCIFVYGVFFYLLGLQDAMQTMDNWSGLAIILIFYFPVVIYSLTLESLLDGQTIGKRLLKTKVVKIDGYQATFGDYLIRWIFRIIDFTLLNGLIAFIFVAASSKNQRLGDMAAGTAVISLKNDVTIDNTILEDIGEEYIPVYPQVIKLTDNDVRIIKENTVSSKARKDYQMLAKLRSKIETVTGIKHSDVSDVEFLDTVLKDYNYYTQSM
ncbi:MAG TPA: RDD family protein [Flavobacterium sp.]|nr:RDD family protein [Flavobacterium sp.]